MDAPVTISRRALADAWPLQMVDAHPTNHTWSINTYRACDIRCTYCITNAQGTSRPRFAEDQVRGQLARELDALGARAEGRTMSVGSFCDVYPSVEAGLRVTRAALEVLHARRTAFNLITKGPTVVRDIDLLARPGVEVQISLNTLDPAVVARWEPGAASPEVRLSALRLLGEAGVAVRLQIAPWIPGITDVAALLDRIPDGTPVTTTPLRLPPYLRRAARSYGLTQAEVNEGFRREYEEVGARAGVRWSRPPPLDGAAVSIEDNVGREQVRQWSPAPAYSPAFGPAPAEPDDGP